MGGALARRLFGDAEAERGQVEAREERLAPAEQDRRRTARCSSSTRPACRYWRSVETPPPMRTSRPPAAARARSERLVDALGDEVEGRAALHLERGARVVRQDEHRHMVRRVVAPPAAPRPRPARGRGRDRTCCARGSRRRGSRSRGPLVVVGPGAAAVLRRARRGRCALGKNHRCSSAPPCPAGCRGSGPARRRSRRGRSRSLPRAAWPWFPPFRSCFATGLLLAQPIAYCNRYDDASLRLPHQPDARGARRPLEPPS